MTDILIVDKLRKSFGRLLAVYDLSFKVGKGEILGVIGPNGAGKTTLFNLLMGTLDPDQGEIFFQGKNITHKSSAIRSCRGIGRTYQVPRPFNKMTVFENLLVAAVHGGGKRKKPARDGVRAILEMIGLNAVQNQLAGGLPLLDRKCLELGRTLATDPKLILLDEVAGGLTEEEAHQILKMVHAVRESGVTIIWIEHLLGMMTDGVDRLLAITQGRFLTSGDPEAVMNSKEILKCYLGEEEEEEEEEE